MYLHVRAGLGGFAFTLLDNRIAQAFGTVLEGERRRVGEEVHLGGNLGVDHRLDEFDAEYERGVRRNHRERGRTVAHGRAHAQPAHAAFAHAVETEFPALDHLACAKNHLERLAQILGTAELAAAQKPARVMHLQVRARHRGLARADLLFVNLEALVLVLPLELVHVGREHVGFHGFLGSHAFHFEIEVGIRRNAFERIFAIRERVGNRKLANLAHLHAKQAFVPARNHLAHANRELERFAARIRIGKGNRTARGSLFGGRIRSGRILRGGLHRRIKLDRIGHHVGIEETLVMHLDQLARANLVAIARFYDFHIERNRPSHARQAKNKKNLQF